MVLWKTLRKNFFFEKTLKTHQRLLNNTRKTIEKQLEYMKD